MANKAGILNVIIGAKISDFLTKMQMVERKTARTKHKSSSEVWAMAKAFGLAFAAIGTAVVRMSAKFSSEMTKIETLVGISRKEVDKMRSAVLRMAGDTGRAPQDLAEGLFFITSAGLRGSEAMDALRASAQAAALGLGETKDVADAVTSIMNAYGSEVYSAEDATNLLLKTVKLGKVEASSLASSLGQVIPIASALGISFEEIGANVATVTRIGLGAEETMTTLKGLMNTFLNPSKQASDRLAEFGLNAEMMRRKLREDGLLDTLLFLKETFKGNTEALGDVIPNIRALTNFMATAEAQADTYRQNLEGMTDGVNDLANGIERLEEDAMHRLNKAWAQLNSELVLGEDSLRVVIGLVDTLYFLLNPKGAIQKSFIEKAKEDAKDLEKVLKSVHALGIQTQQTGLGLLGYGQGGGGKSSSGGNDPIVKTETARARAIGLSERAMAESRKEATKLKNEVEELNLKQGENVDATYSMADAHRSLGDRLKDMNSVVTDFAETFITKWGKLVNYIMQSAQQMSNVFNMFHQNRMNDLTAQEERERAQWEAAYAGADNYDQKMKELSASQEARRKRIQKEEAERQKAIATFQATISAAMAVLSVFADPTLPFGVKLAAAGVIGGLAAAQVAAINGAQLPAFAGGGVVPRTGSILVGERGPEIISANAGAVVTPNHRLGGAMNLQTDFDRERFVIWANHGGRHHSLRRANIR